MDCDKDTIITTFTRNDTNLTGPELTKGEWVMGHGQYLELLNHD